MPFFAKSDATWGGTLGEEEAIVHGGKQTSQSNNTPTKSYNPIESDCMAGCTLMPPQPFPLLTHPCLVGGGRGGVLMRNLMWPLKGCGMWVSHLQPNPIPIFLLLWSLLQKKKIEEQFVSGCASTSK